MRVLPTARPASWRAPDVDRCLPPPSPPRPPLRLQPFYKATHDIISLTVCTKGQTAAQATCKGDSGAPRRAPP